MGDKTGISWTDATWNCVRGCSRVSEGCTRCYAEVQAARIVRMAKGKPSAYDGLVRVTAGGEPRWTGVTKLVPEMLSWPLKKRKPIRIFVNSMSDLFHESLTNDEIAAVFGVMAACPQHTFQCLTKRAKRMREWFEWLDKSTPKTSFGYDPRALACLDITRSICKDHGIHLEYSTWNADIMSRGHLIPWPLPNVWLGVSVEDQDAADERIPELLSTPAAVRFLSCEPLLSGLDVRKWLGSHDDNRRPGNTGIGSGGLAERRSEWSYLAASRDVERVSDRRAGDLMQAAESRYGSVKEGRVSTSAGDDRSDSLHNRSPSNRLDGRAPEAHSGRDRDQPQERDKGRQSPEQLRVSHETRERDPRSTQTRTLQGARRETGTGAGCPDQASKGPEDDVSGRGRGTVWDQYGDGAKYREPSKLEVDTRRIDWLICGCESGPRARPCDVAWLRSLREQCRSAGVSFFLKQGGDHRLPITGRPMTAGVGSKCKAGGVIELPYLDGVQHVEFPHV